MNNATVEYYNANAENYVEDTITADTSDLRGIFLNYLKPGNLILDFGCGSGRDAKAFLDAGYRVEAIDGSIELCRLAEQNTGIPVRNILFQQLDANDRYNGIWACASILHLDREGLSEVLPRISAALQDHGIAYLSFKYGSFEGERNGRWFTDMNEEKLQALLSETPELEIIRMWVTQDVRKDRSSERWLNAIVRRYQGKDL